MLSSGTRIPDNLCDHPLCCLTNICHDEDPFYATHFHTAPTKYEIAHKNIKKYHQHHLFLNCSIFGSYAKMWLERTV